MTPVPRLRECDRPCARNGLARRLAPIAAKGPQRLEHFRRGFGNLERAWRRPERLTDHRSLSREAGTGRYQEFENKRGVSGEGQAKARRARVLVVARSFLYG